MRRKTKIRIAQYVLFIIVYAILGWIALDKYHWHKNINTPENFPDPNFRQSVETFMHVEPGEYFSAAKAAAKTSRLICEGREISDLTGLQYFTNIQEFNCQNNQITHLDITANLKLEILCCSNNQLSEIDVTPLDRLKDIQCNDNQLTSLDVSRNPGLKSLSCSGNLLEQLNLLNNRRLSYLLCKDNRLETLDLSLLTELMFLNCAENSLEKLDLTKNVNLRNLSCGHNRLERLDMSKNSLLQDLDCRQNRVVEFKQPASSHFHSLSISHNQLTELDLSSGAISLYYIDVSHNQLSQIPKISLSTIGGIDLRFNNLGEDDFDDLRQLKKQYAGDPTKSSRDNQSFLISPQNGIDPFEIPD